MNTLTKKQIKSLNASERFRLLKLLVDSFNNVTVTGLYGSEATILSKDIYRGSRWKDDGSNNTTNPKGNDIIISTDLTTG